MISSTRTFPWLRLLVIGALVVLAPPPAGVAAPALPKKTYTYKTVGETKIEADVYRAADMEVRPVVIWLHGGALIVGSRSAVPHRLLELCRQEGFVLVSFDYRLAPEVKLPTILEDVRDAFRWLRERGPGLLHSDPDRFVITGGSAGGYLTLTTGFRVKPRPRALVAYWGYGDVDGDWYTKPSEHYRKQGPLIGKAEAFRAVGGRVLTGAEGDTQKTRGRFYLYLRQNGLWAREVSGFDPSRDARKLDPYCPVRNVTADYPPTLLIHGTEDTDVPYEQSAAMAKELARHKVPHELITVRGAGHGLAGGDKKLVDDAHEKSLAFIRKHLKAEGKGAGAKSSEGPNPGRYSPERYEVQGSRGHRVKMRDGVRLSVDVYRPAGARFPGILVHTPYNNNSPAWTQRAKWFARRGYAVAVSDVAVHSLLSTFAANRGSFFRKLAQLRGGRLAPLPAWTPSSN